MSTVRTATTSTATTATAFAVGTSIVVPAALLALGLAGPVPLPEPLRPAHGLAVGTLAATSGFARATTGSATAFAGGTAGSAASLAGTAATDAVEVAQDVAAATVPAALDTATTTAQTASSTVDRAVETALQVVERGSATACPGAPVATGVELRPGSVVTLTRPTGLRTPRAVVATAAAVLEGTSVGTPSAATLLRDPASVQLHGSGTGVSISAPVVDEVREGTSVQLGSASAEPSHGAAGSDVETASALAPQVEVGLGRQLLRLDESVTVTTAGLGGPLTLRTTTGGGCTAVSWTITR